MVKKETICNVVLGVALVSLVSAVIGALIESMTLLIDYNDVNRFDEYLYPYAIGAVEMGLALAAIGFTAAIVAAKKKRNKLTIVAAVVILLYFIASVIVFRINVETYARGRIDSRDYSLFLSYVTTSVSLAISAVLAAGAYIMLAWNKKQDNAEAVAPSTETNGDSSNN
ncbi:MAG: hypothetical protein J1G38_06740 [Clostridiales bacterium]|nr:hypothetical protein [Clostridiales bacterium]